jgi:hypothetical protein
MLVQMVTRRDADFQLRMVYQCSTFSAIPSIEHTKVTLYAQPTIKYRIAGKWIAIARHWTRKMRNYRNIPVK